MNFHLRPYNQYILNIVTNIYLGLDFIEKEPIFLGSFASFADIH